MKWNNLQATSETSFSAVGKLVSKFGSKIKKTSQEKRKDARRGEGDVRKENRYGQKWDAKQNYGENEQKRQKVVGKESTEY
jgi:hypothetical protein